MSNPFPADEFISATLRNELRAQARQLLAMQPPRRRSWRSLTSRVKLAATTAPLLWMLLGLGGMLVLVALGVMAVTWPVVQSPPSESTANVVVAVATATAFGSVLFTFVGVSFTNASSISAGYSATRMTAFVPWIPGVAGIAFSGLIFTYALLGPSANGAFAAVIASVGFVVLGWAGAVESLRRSDPLSVSQHAAAHYRRVARRSRGFFSESMRFRYRDFARNNPELFTLALRDDDLRLPRGFVRQLGAGIRATSTPQRIAEAAQLFDGIVGIVRDEATASGGNIGGDAALVEPTFAVARTLAMAAVEFDRSEISDHVVTELGALAREEFSDADFESLRFAFVRLTKNLIEKTWSDDQTSTTFQCLTEIGECYAAWVTSGRQGLASEALEALASFGAKALTESRPHIVQAVAGAFARGFVPAVAHESSPYEGDWIKKASQFGTLALVLDDRSAMRHTDPLIPGSSFFVSVTGLQSHVQRLAPDNYLRAGRFAIDLARRALSGVRRFEAAGSEARPGGTASDADAEGLHKPRFADQRALELAYFGAYLLATGTLLEPARANNPRSKSDELAGLSKSVDAILNLFAQGAPFERVEDTLELAWSLVLATSFVLRDQPGEAVAFADFANLLKAHPQHDQALTYDNYAVGVMLGLQALAGATESDLAGQEQRWASARASARFGSPLGTWEHQVEGYGRAPRPARNTFAIRIAVLDEIDSWACAQWPSLVGPGA